MTTATFPQHGTAPVARVGDSVESSGLHAFAFKLYLLFMVSWFLHVPARLQALGPLRVDLLLVVAITGAILMSPATLFQRLDTRISRLILALFAFSLVAVPFVEWPGSVIKSGIPDLVKAVVFYYFTVLLVTSKQRLSRALVVFVACQAFRVLEPLYLHITTGYWGSAAHMGGAAFLSRLAGAPSDIVNPNGLAQIVVTVIAFAHYLWTPKPVGRVAYLGLLPMLLYALVLTGSRSGLVSLVATFGIIWLQSRQKVLLGLVGAAVVLFSIPRLSAELQDRYISIVDQRSTMNATTASARWEEIKDDFRVAMRRPLFGHGLGTSKEANTHFAGRDRPSHNLFTEVAQELGFLGMPVFAALLVSIGYRVRSALRALRASPTADPLLVRLCRALQVWFVVNILSSMFTYGLSSYDWYFMAGLANVVMLFLSAAAVTNTDAQAGSAKGPGAAALNPITSPGTWARRIPPARRRRALPARGMT